MNWGEFNTAPYHSVTYQGPSDEAYQQGKQYFIHITKMSDGRRSVFKTLNHFKEDPGYRVYNSIEEINQLFHVNNKESN